MDGIERVLAYDLIEDEAHLAVDHAADIARAAGARLTVMRILRSGPRLLSWPDPNKDADQVLEFLEKSQRQILEDYVEPLREDGLRVDVEVRWGTPWLEIVRSVVRDRFDLVVKAAEGAARGRGLFFGSTALHLIRKCPCPVWIVGSAEHGERPRVLAAIDPAEDETRSAVARRVLDLAGWVAGGRGELHAVSVWRAIGETMLRRRVSPEELGKYVQEARERARTGLQHALEASDEEIPEERVWLLNGDESEVLPRLIEEREFDIVVMGSLGRLGIAGLLIGDTAETLIRSVRCSVVVVKPPGFVTPVEVEVEAEGPSPTP